MSGELIIENVSAGYDRADVLDDVSLRVRPGAITCLLGANGAGKSTLIRAILSLTPPRRGKVTLDGREITGLPTHKIIAAGLACIPEGRKVFPKMTVEENLRIGAYLQPDNALITRRVGEIYEIFPRLRERRHQPAGTLSGGEQAMVSIGRGLVGSPKILLIDEPSLGLSPKFVDECFKVIRDVCRGGTTVFLVEQNVRQSLAIGDHGYVFSKGRVVASGTTRELADSPEVRDAYFGEAAHASPAR